MKQKLAILWRTLPLALCCLTFSGSAIANPEAVAKFKDWTVFTASVDGQRVCYAATEATDEAPASADHGDVWFYVTSWASGQVRSQPSLKVGYELRADLAPSARIGRAGWTLFSAGNEAFAADDDDPQLVRALKRGSELRVEAVSARDTQVAYHFSLAGSSAAIDRAADSCR
ncbi:MAG: invasion associated locus B family protein [Pseudomonadota bacterium]